MNIMRATHEPKNDVEGFVPSDFSVKDWNSIAYFYDDLVKRQITSLEELEQWIYDRNELEAFIGEDFSWKYIHITSDSANKKALESYQYALKELLPHVSSFEHILNEKLVTNPFFSQLPSDQFSIYTRNVRNAVQIFNEKNIPLTTEVQLKAKEHGRIFSEMTIGLKGMQMTLQKAGTLLEENDRGNRENIYHKINERILQDTESLETLFDGLLNKRHKIALNANFDNFRDYRFKALGRFDYSASDCFDFHEAIQYEILPILDELNRYRKQRLGIDKLKPWDLHVDVDSKAPLRPFQTIDELIEKSITCVSKLDESFGDYLRKLKKMNHLDLDSRKGKRPGGYNMPLPKTGAPFIFMNATNSLNDMRTFLHESGHAFHSFLTKKYKLNSSKRVPSEVAELAAMTMELLTMDHWDVFFENPDDLRRAKINQLETALKVLPWVATIDKFQHWLYVNPTHAPDDRKKAWMSILKEFSSSEIDQEGLERYSEYIWHKQLHIFEVPFYYIEYGMAQLGAIAIWKQYRENPKETIENYINALKLGYTKPIREIYETAGISFDFSREYVAELGDFLKKELKSLLF